MVNDAKFQQVVDWGTSTLQADLDAFRLLAWVVGELRASAR